MSHARRALVIFAVLLLVAAGVFAVRLATEKPATDALRFSMVDTTGPRELIPGLSGPCSVESIAVENTGAVPIHLISMWVTETATPGVAGINIALAPESSSHAGSTSTNSAASDVIVVPPKGTIYATTAVPLASALTAAGAREPLRMNALWQPRTQYLVGRALEWLHSRSPRSLQPHIPSLSATFDNAVIEPHPYQSADTQLPR